VWSWLCDARIVVVVVVVVVVAIVVLVVVIAVVVAMLSCAGPSKCQRAGDLLSSARDVQAADRRHDPRGVPRHPGAAQAPRPVRSSAFLHVCPLWSSFRRLPPLVPLWRREIVRKKAIMALQRCFQLDATSVSGMSDVVRRALCDKDPSVMGATLHILFDLCKIEPTSYKDLVPSFVSILKQIIGMCVCV
jgi:hypothetical protein